jgi:pSer/pThr/pTyr-binding forkhead associated (FHA) protein
MAVLIGMSVEVKGKTFNVDKSPFTIGRSSDNSIHIDNISVSGHHCEIVTEGDHYTLRDTGSTNGTRVNNKDVKEHLLRPKDLVQVGSIEFLFNAEGEPLDATPADEAGPQTEVIVSEGPVEQPTSFESISPFGARRREKPGAWWAAIVVVGLLALASVAFLLFTLFAE